MSSEFRLGWPTILGSLICFALSVAAIPVYLQGIFLTDLQGEFGWSRGQISFGSTVQLTVLAFMSPIAGFAADRFGIRVPTAISLLGVAFVYAAMGWWMHSYAGFLALQALLSILGAATLPVVFTRAVNSWFDRSRGLALGCTLIGTGITATFGPAFVTWAILQYGWRGAYLAIAAVVLVLTPLVVWLMRTSPAEATLPAAYVGADEGRPGFSRAWRQPLFWALGATFFLQASAVIGMISHMTPLLVDEGLTRPEAGRIAGLIGIAVIAGRFFVGALMDRFFAPYVAAAVVVICAAGCAALALGGQAVAPLGALAIGFAIGAEVDVIGYLTSRYYAVHAYARLYGVQYAIFLLGAALSPFWIGRAFDYFGSYRVALYACSGVLIVAALILLRLPRYQTRH
jgi:MFS family permease